MKKIILFMCTFLSALSLFAADIDIYKDCPPKAKEMIDKAQALADQEKYESAFGALIPVLTTDDGKDDFYEGGDYVLLLKTEYAINYFAQSMMHQMFAFKNFEEGDTFHSVRTGEGSFNLIMFDPVERIEAYAAVKGMSPALYLALAEYYNDVDMRYPGQWLISSDELKKKAVENYEQAYNAGLYNINTLENYGLILLNQHNCVQAQNVFIRLLGLDTENPAGWYNLAISYYYNHEFEKAINAFKAAIKYPEEDINYRYDAWELMAAAYYQIGEEETAVKTLEDAKTYFPDFYRANITLARYLLGLREDKEGALKEFEEAYNINLNDDEIIYQILNEYMSFNLNDEAVNFCELELKKVGKKEYFARAYLNVYLVQLYAMKAQAGVEYEDSVKKAKAAFTQIEPNFKKAKYSDYEEMYNQLQDLINSL